MRHILTPAIALSLLLATAACGPRVQYLRTTETVTTTTYPVYTAPSTTIATTTPVGPPSAAQVAARRQRESQHSGNPEAWSSNGYHYDQWGNLIRVDR